MGSWNVYRSAKKHLCDGAIDLDTDTFKMSLFTSASNAATELSVIGSISNEVANGNGYSSGGKIISGVTWTAGDSASAMRFGSDVTTWMATSAGITNIRYAVISTQGASAAARKLLCRAELTAVALNVAPFNTLNIGPRPGGFGYFQLA